MINVIEDLLSTYEHGRISRRDLVLSLSTLALAPRVAEAQRPAIPARTLNHVTMMVTDVERSARFYRKLFGLSVKTRQAEGVNLAVGDAFLGIYDRASFQIDSSQIHHICFGVDDFRVAEVMDTLADQGLQGTVRTREETVPEVYFRDPDGLTVQLQDVSYCGGTGELGNVCP